MIAFANSTFIVKEARIEYGVVIQIDPNKPQIIRVSEKIPCRIQPRVQDVLDMLAEILEANPKMSRQVKSKLAITKEGKFLLMGNKKVNLESIVDKFWMMQQWVLEIANWWRTTKDYKKSWSIEIFE